MGVCIYVYIHMFITFSLFMCHWTFGLILFILAIVNNAAMKMGLQISLQHTDFISLDIHQLCFGSILPCRKKLLFIKLTFNGKDLLYSILNWSEIEKPQDILASKLGKTFKGTINRDNLQDKFCPVKTSVKRSMGLCKQTLWNIWVETFKHCNIGVVVDGTENAIHIAEFVLISPGTSACVERVFS